MLSCVVLRNNFPASLGQVTAIMVNTARVIIATCFITCSSCDYVTFTGTQWLARCFVSLEKAVDIGDDYVTPVSLEKAVDIGDDYVTPIKGTPVDKKAGRHGKQKGHNRAREKGNGASRHAIYA